MLDGVLVKGSAMECTVPEGINCFGNRRGQRDADDSCIVSGLLRFRTYNTVPVPGPRFFA